MFRSIVAAILAMILTAATPTNAFAIFYTSNGEIFITTNEQPSPGAPPAEALKRLGGSETGGQVFTNQYSGNAFTEGGLVRTISIQIIETARDGQPEGDPRLPSGSQFVVITAIDGEITSGTGVGDTDVIATFRSGRTLVLEAATDLNLTRPDTWGFSAGGVIAEYALAVDSVQTGFDAMANPIGTAVGFVSSSIMNTSSTNSATADQGQGRFLFLEDSTNEQNMVVGGGDAFLDNVEIPVQLSGQTDLTEGFFVSTSQRVEFLTLQEQINQLFLDDDDLDALNTIANYIGLTPVGGDVNGIASGFATGLGGTDDTDFSPGFPPFGTPTGDFRGTLSTTADVVVGVIPEPTSIALFGVGAIMLGVCGYRRRHRKIAE